MAYRRKAGHHLDRWLYRVRKDYPDVRTPDDMVKHFPGGVLRNLTEISAAMGYSNSDSTLRTANKINVLLHNLLSNGRARYRLPTDRLWIALALMHSNEMANRRGATRAPGLKFGKRNRV